MRGAWIKLTVAGMAFAIAAPVLGGGAQAASAPCLPLLCKFSISGKRGVFIVKQMTPARLAAADAKLSAKVTGMRSLAEQSASRGEFAGTGLEMRETRRALEALLIEIRKGWPAELRQPQDVTVRIIGSTDYNPSARPDNVIVVPLGVLMRAQSDDEVAWVLAHEFSHIGLGHFSREAEQRAMRSTVSKEVMGVQTAAEMSQQRVDTSGQRMRFYMVKDPDAEKISYRSWAYSRKIGTALELVNQHLSRKQEDEADVAAMDLVLAGGYADTGPGAALEAVEEDERRAAAAMTSFQQQLGDYTAKSGAVSLQKLANGQAAKSVTDEFMEDLKSNFGRMLMDKAIQMAKTSHRPAATRRRGVADYLNTAYPELDAPRSRTTWLQSVKTTSEFTQAATAVTARDEALVKLSSTSPNAAAEAWAALKPALATPYRYTPLVGNMTAKIYQALGDDANADKTYDHVENPAATPAAAPALRASAKGGKGKGKSKAPAAPSPPLPSAASTDILYSQSLEGFRDHVALLLRMKSYPKVLSVVQEAKKRFGDDDPFLPALITVYAQTRKADLLAATIARCLETEDGALRKSCQYAMFNDEQLKTIDALPPAERAKVELAMDHQYDATRRASWWQTLATQMNTTED